MPRLDVSGSVLDLDAVLFDVGGTLLRLDHGFVAARAARGGPALDAGDVARGEAQARREIDRRAGAEGGVHRPDAERLHGYLADVLVGAGQPRERAEPLASELVAEHHRENLWRVPLPGAAAALAALRRRGLRLAAVSNADGRVAAQLAAAGLASHLDAILDSRVEGVEKPDPELFRRALARLGDVPAARAAYVGDIYSIDVLGARAAGLAPILIDETGSQPHVDCARIASLDELACEDRAPAG